MIHKKNYESNIFHYIIKVKIKLKIEGSTRLRSKDLIQ